MPSLFYASVVQWKGQWSSKPSIGVRVPAGAPYGGVSVMVNTEVCGTSNTGSIPVHHPTYKKEDDVML